MGLPSDLEWPESQTPGFAYKNFKMTEEDLLFDGQPNKPGNFKVFEYSFSFMHGGKEAGIYLSWPVD